jgi:hypothetical protein
MSDTDDIKKREDLISLIDFEINRSDTINQQNGWTTWALLGAFGGIIWLALSNEFSQMSFFSERILFMFLTLSFVFELLFNTPLVTIRPHRSTSRIQFWTPFVCRPIFPRIVQIIRYISYIVILIISRWYIHPYAFYLVFSFCVISIGLEVMLFILGLSGINNKIISIIFYAILMIATIALVLVAFHRHPEFSTLEIKLSGLITTAIFIIMYLTVHIQHNQLSVVLHDIRRKLSLNEMRYDEAKYRMSIVLYGMLGGQDLNNEISGILNIISRDESEIKQYIHNSSEIIKLTPHLATNFSDKQKEAFSKLNAKHKVYDTKSKMAVEKLLNSYYKKLKLISFFSPESRAELYILGNNMVHAMKLFKPSVIQTFNSSMDSIAASFPAIKDEIVKLKY